MQLLTFTIDSEVYAIPSRQVIEVLPLVAGRPIPRMPEYVAGLLTYRGRLVPLLDLGMRIAGVSPRKRLSTRVIVVEFARRHGPSGGGAGDRDEKRTLLAQLGLIAENVVSIRAVEEQGAAATPLELPDAPYLGRILRIGPNGGQARAGRGNATVQLIDVERLLPEELLQGLFPDTPAAEPRMTSGHAGE